MTAGRRWAASAIAFTMAAGVLLGFEQPASAVIVPTVPLGVAADYAVLGGASVVNTGPTTLQGSVGVWPTPSITGAPVVIPPGTTEVGTEAAHQAQIALGIAYADAAGRTPDAAILAELGNQTLVGGVYSELSKAPLSLNGPLVLDGVGDPNSVFIFQTDSTLTAGLNGSVTLINGAQECNVFWQVGSSATLGTGSTLSGTILAHDSITLVTGVTVHGRALAEGATVTLDSNTFFRPTCDLTPVTTTSTVPVTTTSTAPVTTTSTAPVTTTSTVPVTTTSTAPVVTTTSTPDPVTTTSTGRAVATSTTAPGQPGSSAPVVLAVSTNAEAPAGDGDAVGGAGLPRVAAPPATGGAPLRTDHGFPWLTVVFVIVLAGAGLAFVPPPARR